MSELRCDVCDYVTDVHYDAVCHGYATGHGVTVYAEKLSSLLRRTQRAWLHGRPADPQGYRRKHLTPSREYG